MRSKKGFTLIEILFVIIILAAMASLAIPRITRTINQGKTDVCNANIKIMNTQIEQYRLQTGSYPADNTAFNSLLHNLNYFPSAPECPFNSATTPFPYSYDAINDMVTSHGH